MIAALVIARLGSWTVENWAEPVPPADEAEQARLKKASAVTAQKRSTLERLIYKLDDDLLLERMLDAPRGIYARLGGIGEGAGFGVGPAFRYNATRFDFKTSAAASMKTYFIGEASLRFPGTMSATRYDGKDLGNFEYHGTRSDDPNDIYPHEHRRELRANRVFAAWLAHDDSRALNTRNVRVVGDGRNYIRHYVRDFGAILGSSTRFTEPPISNHEYYVEKDSSLKRLFTLGFYTPNYLRTRAPENIPPSVGWFESSSFEPDAWKPNYPNAAFSNMQLDDAFWGARLVSRFSDGAIRAIVEQAGYDDPQAVDYLTRTLVRRRDIIARTWLNGVNPIVDVSLDATGTLSFTNAAVAAGVAAHGTYTIAWARFDNESGSSARVSVEKHTRTARGRTRVVDRERRIHRGHDLERGGGPSRMGVASAGLLSPRRPGLEDRRPHTHDHLRQPAVKCCRGRHRRGLIATPARAFPSSRIFSATSRFSIVSRARYTPRPCRQRRFAL